VGTMLCFILFALYAIPQVSGVAYCTYHNYNAGDSLTTVACSDGVNGVMTKFGYSDLGPMYPYVTAFSGATWNSPNCGRCIQVTNRAKGNSVYLTVIDQCGPPPATHDAHFDIAPPAFRELFGDAGVNAGVQNADWAFVASNLCRGNKGNSGGSSNPPPTPNPQPNPPPAGGCCSSSVRCGSSWANANSVCGTACTNDGPCNGQQCFADLQSCPPRAVADSNDEFTEAVEESSFDAAFGEELNTEAVEEEYSFDAAFGEETVEAVEEYYDAASGEDVFAYDAAVADESQTASQAQSEGMPSWAVALVVLASVVLVALIAVVVQLAKMLRQ